MALFPVISNFQYDFVLQLVPVDTDNTMDEVAAAAAHAVLLNCSCSPSTGSHPARLQLSRLVTLARRRHRACPSPLPGPL